MKTIIKVSLSLLFGFALLELFIVFRLDQINTFKGLGLVGLTISAGFVYYLIFERKKKRKAK